MTWRTDKPSRGEWIVIDSSYGTMTFGYFSPQLGWCIRGRWLGHDAVLCFHALPTYPDLAKLDLPKPEKVT